MHFLLIQSVGNGAMCCDVSGVSRNKSVPSGIVSSVREMKWWQRHAIQLRRAPCFYHKSFNLFLHQVSIPAAIGICKAGIALVNCLRRGA